MGQSNNRPSKSSRGNSKSMDVEAQIEITEDVTQYLTPDLVRQAFRMSLLDDLPNTAVHKVLVDEEYVRTKDKDVKEIEVLRAVARVTPNVCWLAAFPQKASEI